MKMKNIRNEISLDQVISSGEIPDHILHHFACDCAERALLREREEGREPEPQYWEALRIKRLWLEGEATDQDLDTARFAAWDAARIAAGASHHVIEWEFELDPTWAPIWAPARAASRGAAQAVARTAAWAAARAVHWGDWWRERDWQKEHLADLLSRSC